MVSGFIIIIVNEPPSWGVGFHSPFKKRNNTILVSVDGQEVALEAGSTYRIEVEPGEHQLLARDNDLLEKRRGKTIAKAVGAFAFGSLASGSFYGIKDGLDSMGESLDKSRQRLNEDAWTGITLMIGEGQAVNVVCEMTKDGKVKVFRS